jgi:hypothetical protein
MAEMRNIHKTEGKTHIGRRRRSLEDNIKVECREISIEDVNWINMALDICCCL